MLPFVLYEMKRRVFSFWLNNKNKTKKKPAFQFWYRLFKSVFPEGQQRETHFDSRKFETRRRRVRTWENLSDRGKAATSSVINGAEFDSELGGWPLSATTRKQKPALHTQTMPKARYLNSSCSRSVWWLHEAAATLVEELAQNCSLTAVLLWVFSFGTLPVKPG